MATAFGRILFFVVMFTILTSELCAQKVSGSQNRQAQKSYETARQYIGVMAYERAITELKEAVRHDPGFIAAYQQLGDLYRRHLDYLNALKSYQQVIAIDPEFNHLTYYGLAESELNTGDYNSALLHFRRYLTSPGLSEESKSRVEKYIRDCLFSIEAVKNPVEFKPVNMGPAINSAADEYLPTMTADEQTIIFTRKKNNNEDFYKSIRQGEGWKPAESLSSGINTTQFNEGAQCITPDGIYIFFTGCNRPDGLGRCDIYLSKWEGNEWSEPFNIGGPVNTSGWESQPSISADGRTLYFVSNRGGGKGGYDIWKSELGDTGTWGVPVNLGPDINTPYDEQSPFIHPDGESLYF